MVIIKETNPFNDLFAEKMAKLKMIDGYIILEFLKPFSIGRGKNYRKGDTLTYEVFSPKDLNEFKQKTGIKQLPCELVNNETFKKVFYFVGGQ
ncbi:hypothetical protein M0Q39_06315 [Patescibacteria group bacterium]|nr:hypothetical protein [Patescibacteria group bacterium]